MSELDKKAVLGMYFNQSIQFPMIGAVILGNTEGVILSNSNSNPTHVFIVNKFGFCQEMYKNRDNIFFNSIVKRFIESKDRQKLRLYNPDREFLQYINQLKCAQSVQRRHFQLPINCIKNNKYNIDGIKITLMSEDDFEDTFQLQLSSRYYSNIRDFCTNAMPYVAKENNKIVGIIYSAANDGLKCEVDIQVDEAYRRRGIAKLLVNRFAKACNRRNWIINWDCYDNNLASVNVAKACGFKLIGNYTYCNIHCTK